MALDALPRRRTVKSYSPGYTRQTITVVKPKVPKKCFNILLHRLKTDGLITLTDSSNAQFKISMKGISWLRKILEVPHVSSPDYTKKVEKSDKTIIISYDIPERLRTQRSWLRLRLKEMHFQKMQQSVWLGKVKLPEEFIADLTRYSIDRYIEIFEITKAGTIKHTL